MLTVRIIFLDGSEDIKECWDISEIVLDNVKEIKVIRNEKAA